MARFGNEYPGAITVARKKMVYDGYTQNGNVDFTISQPANSVIENVYYRQIKAPTFATAMDVGMTVGTTEGGTEIATASTDGIADGATTIAEGYTLVFNGNSGSDITWTFQYSADDAATPAIAPGFTQDHRDIHFRVTCTDDVVSVQGDYEVTAVFKIFE